jgi:hypothetical protein
LRKAHFLLHAAARDAENGAQFILTGAKRILGSKLACTRHKAVRLTMLSCSLLVEHNSCRMAAVAPYNEKAASYSVAVGDKQLLA